MIGWQPLLSSRFIVVFRLIISECVFFSQVPIMRYDNQIVDSSELPGTKQLLINWLIIFL